MWNIRLVYDIHLYEFCIFDINIIIDKKREPYSCRRLHHNHQYTLLLKWNFYFKKYNILMMNRQ